ncbi:NAD(P)/FAD-dependent oxidoreductase [Steroidobacter sp. S1-65]|uniref:NAD(P)/FAD-dependent oxidoreductase n=1 Tax=Steroidobacter gossypii TaxID=2805490 RepID=A0ABS1WV13_9GAMM|nr:NAD(P)/FAD-dependent oxidoreductase [Steroidobacter gossypii]MBM0104798.1 NAD(P)/FAD-dependent oxidoreductase [Steroidobacter gossypii]
MATDRFDVTIVGAGPAGLSAALVLGRAHRKVLVCDSGTPRNWASKAIHSYLSRDGIDPTEFREQARSELARYSGVVIKDVEVTELKRAVDHGFEATLGDASRVLSRKVLLATGVLDHLPPLPDIEAFFGTSVFQCPYCDGWEMRDRPVAAYGKRQRGFEMARALTAWFDDIVLCTDGAPGLSEKELEQLRQNGIELRAERIERLEGDNGQLQAILFRNGERLPRTALFFDMPASEQSTLAQALGCAVTSQGRIKCGQYESTSVPGVFAAGNIIGDVQLAIVAAAEGARAAFGINRALTREDFDAPNRGGAE